jgi:hypothetical protein
MRDAGYIAAGYLLTGAVVATYATSVRLRLRRALARLRQAAPQGGER